MHGCKNAGYSQGYSQGYSWDISGIQEGIYLGYTISYTLAQILMIHSQDTAHSVHNTLLQLGVGSCGGWVKAGYSGIYIPASGYS